MEDHILMILPTSWENWVFDSDWSFREASGLLGLVWEDKTYRTMKRESELHLTFVECETGSIIHSDTYQWHGVVNNIQLRPDNAEDCWILTWEGFSVANTPSCIMLCTTCWNTPMLSTTPILIDQAVDRMTRIGPVLYAIGTEHNITVIHLRPGVDDSESTLICVNRVTKENTSGHLQESIADLALRASVCVQDAVWYTVMFDAEWDESEKLAIEFPPLAKKPPKNVLTQLGQFLTQSKAKPQDTIRTIFRDKPYWRFWIAGGNFPVNEPSWKHQLPIRIPATADPFADFWSDVVAGTVIVTGPSWKSSQQDERQTVIVAIGLVKQEAIGLPEEQARPLRGGELLCLSQDGHVVQECKEEIVEQVELCLVGDSVIGVDRIQRRWRLWQWEPLAGKEQFTTVRLLDEEVVHAHVVTNHENSDPQGTHFWLVEERPEGLKVSRRNRQMLEEREEPVMLKYYSLPYSLERSIGHWDWPIKKGIIGYQDALLLIAADEQNRMVLYRVEEG